MLLATSALNLSTLLTTTFTATYPSLLSHIPLHFGLRLYNGRSLPTMFTLALLLALLPSIVVAAPHQRHDKHRGDMSCMQPQSVTVGKAIYFLTNDAENAIVALPIGVDGMLTKGAVVKTGGAGSNSVDAMGQPAAPDGLVGQSASTVVGNVSFLQLPTIKLVLGARLMSHRTSSP